MPLPRHCPNCGALVTEDATFCSKCGASLGSQQSTTPGIFQSESPSPNLPYSPARSVQPYESSQRLERVSRRVELLSYAIIGLSVIILIESMYWFGFFG